MDINLSQEDSILSVETAIKVVIALFSGNGVNPSDESIQVIKPWIILYECTILI